MQMNKYCVDGICNKCDPQQGHPNIQSEAHNFHLKLTTTEIKKEIILELAKFLQITFFRN